MKKHVKIYLEANGYDVCDTIPCEIPHCGQVAVDIHHVYPRGMGGTKKIEVEENLIALCRKDHDKAEASRFTKKFLAELARLRIEARND